MTALFISDLHLHAERPGATRAFYRFLQERAAHADSLYILGDFFDSWIGDDDDEPLGLEVAAALAELAECDTQVFLMHGNRDFLLGQDFCQRAKATLLTDPTVIELNGQRTLLLHGDSLCTRDTEYMAMREQLRSAQWQQQILAQPLAARRALAAQLRAQSQTMNSSKAEDIMDVTPDVVVERMREYRTPLMIHGHTHRPARHNVELDGTTGERIVLGDWHDRAWCLEAGNGRLDVKSWAIRESG